MFTGLIETVGKVASCHAQGDGLLLEVVCEPDFMRDVKEGDSIAVNGVCSTVIAPHASGFGVAYLPETLSCTTLRFAQVGVGLNLEKAMRLSDRLGGHYVTGHVDDIGLIEVLEPSDPWGELVVSYASQWQPYLVQKGSVAVDGISLTIAELTDLTFTCCIIPHTYAHTVLSGKVKGAGVNLEFDLYAKYLYRFHTLEGK